MFIPSKIKHVIECKSQLKFFNEFLKKNNKEPILCLGPSGSGKSFIIELFCKKFNFEIFYFNSSTICNDENKETIEKLVKQQNLNMFYKKKQSNTIIIIDHVHLLNSKNILEQFINQKKHHCIFIGHDIHCKYKNHMKSSCKHIIEFSKPKIKDLIKYFHQFCKELDIKLSSKLTDTNLKKIFKNIDRDYKQFQYFLEMLYNFNQNEWSLKFFNETMKNIKSRKNMNYELYEGTTKILYTPMNIKKILNVIQCDSFLMSKMLHENYLNAYYQTKPNNIISLKKLTEYMMDANQLEYIHETNIDECKDILYSYPINLEIANIQKKSGPILNFTKSLNINSNPKECKFKKLLPFDIKGIFLFDDILLQFFLKFIVKSKKITDKTTIFDTIKLYLKINDDYKIDFKKCITLFK
jgi:adenylate kinase family enzyme